MRYHVGLDEECNMTVVDAVKNCSGHKWSLCFVRKYCEFEPGREHEVFLVASSCRELAHLGKAFWVSSHRPSNLPGSWSFIITPTLRILTLRI
ncbi:hypothetical protein FHG87_017487 [Trinorchestia longiramus]|nr:hypothetical protein FHG87_017487 [Trinorchestia longiramus]